MAWPPSTTSGARQRHTIAGSYFRAADHLSFDRPEDTHQPVPVWCKPVCAECGCVASAGMHALAGSSSAASSRSPPPWTQRSVWAAAARRGRLRSNPKRLRRRQYRSGF
jgi:hypothetical protein